MDLVLKRIAKKPEYTIGKLYINNQYFCDTLEDTDRGLSQDMTENKIKSIKIPGVTAIPTGIYMITITYSPRFKRLLPLVNMVKGFEGIRFHAGNTHKDTDGCILVGQNKAVGKVLNSKATFDKLFNIMQQVYSKKEEIRFKVC